MGKSLDECEKALNEVVDRLKTQKVDDETLNRVKTKLRAALIRKLDSNSGLAAELNFCYVSFGDWKKLFTSIDDYDEIRRTMYAVDKQYFVPQTLVRSGD